MQGRSFGVLPRAKDVAIRSAIWPIDSMRSRPASRSRTASRRMASSVRQHPLVVAGEVERVRPQVEHATVADRAPDPATRFADASAHGNDPSEPGPVHEQHRAGDVPKARQLLVRRGNRGRDGDGLIDEVSDAAGGARNLGMPGRIGAPERPESVFPQESVMALTVPRKDEAARRNAMACGQGQAGLQIGPDGLDRQRGVVEEGVREGVAADLLCRPGGSKGVHDVVAVPERVGVAIGAGVRGEPFAAEPALAGMDELRVRAAGSIAPAFAEIRGGRVPPRSQAPRTARGDEASPRSLA